MSEKFSIGIITAVKVEQDAILKKLINPECNNMINKPCYTGKINGHNVMVVMAGIGKVSAAITTQNLIHYYNPDYIINFGSAGALTPELQIGDIVLAKYASFWDFNTKIFNEPIGYVSELNCVNLNANHGFKKLIKKSIAQNLTLHEGLIVTGDTFVCTDTDRKYILNNFPDALCCEMEGASIAQVCIINKKPFAIVRSISDNACNDSHTNYNLFCKKTAKICADTIENLLLNN